MNRYPWFRNAAYVLVGVGAVALVVVVVVGVVLIRTTQTRNTALVQTVADQSTQIKALAEKIDSCTDQTTDDGDPVGACYAEGQRQTQDIVGIPHGPINTVTVLATYCQLTKGADTVPAILACVDRELKTVTPTP